MNKQGLRLVVIPSDPIAAYEQMGLSSWLEPYYNPKNLFQEVFAISPLENGERRAFGMTILGVAERHFQRTLHDIQPHVIRAYGGFWPADLASRYRVPCVPVVVSLHDTNPARLHKSVRYADLVICTSKAVKHTALDIGIPPKKIRIVPNRISTEIFYPINDQKALEAVAQRFPPGKHILHVGRKSHEKNIDTLIRALKYLPSDYFSIFVGPGKSTPFLAIADKEGVGERCFWVNSVNNEELPPWYSWCDCMCTPSRWEGFGIVFIEAAACGAAIVTSDIPPMNEYLNHNLSACLVKDYENPEALASAIRRVCEDREYREVLSKGGHKASQPFRRNFVDEKEVNVYLETIRSGPLSLSHLDKLNFFIWKVHYDFTILSKRILSTVTHRQANT